MTDTLTRDQLDIICEEFTYLLDNGEVTDILDYAAEAGLNLDQIKQVEKHLYTFGE